MGFINLNEQQKKAVMHLDGPMLALAGPGSGKTTVITCRILYMIRRHKISPNNILVITFTKASSLEMKNRFLELGKINSTCVSFATFHSFFFRVLKKHFGYNIENILKEEEKREIIKKILISEEINFEDEEDFLSNLILEMGLIKSDLLNLEFYDSINIGSSEFKNIVNKYEQYKEEKNKIDFDDMLFKCYELFSSNNEALNYWSNIFKYVLIDEFQDINKVQYECIKLLVSNHKNIFIVGDDDQSIYKFRGARPEFLLKFSSEFPNTNEVTLNINYRSTEEIIKICNAIISQNKNRFEKNIEGTKISGELPSILRPEDINTEAKNISIKIQEISKIYSLNQIAVIYRTNIQSRAFIDSFMHLNIPYQIKDESPSIYEHWLAKDICAYLKLSQNRSDDKSLERIINKPTRYMSKSILAIARKNKKSHSDLLSTIMEINTLKVWQQNKIEEMMFYLNAIKKRTPYEAIKYIRSAVNYDKYIKEYSEFKKLKIDGLLEVMEELLESAKPYKTIEEFLINAEKVIEETKKGKKNKNDASFNGVTLSTIHSVKGLEFDVVFLASAVEGVIPYEKSKTDSEIEEECRLLYVGMTRARKKLFISILKSRHEKESKPSRFFNKIFT